MSDPTPKLPVGAVPKPKFNVGEDVMVRCDEHPAIPFPATVSAVWWCSKYNQHEYRVLEGGDLESDGYTEDWLTARLNTSPPKGGEKTFFGMNVRVDDSIPSNEAHVTSAGKTTVFQFEDVHPPAGAKLETPRTDAAVAGFAQGSNGTALKKTIDHARTLERELAEAKRERDDARVEAHRLQERLGKECTHHMRTVAERDKQWVEIKELRADLDSARKDEVPWELMRGTLKMERHRIPKSIHCESDLCGSERRLTLDGVCIRENGRTNVMAVIESALEHMNGRDIRLVLFATPSSEQEPVREGGEG